MTNDYDCSKCKDKCCKHAEIKLTVLDLAKILHSLKDYEFCTTKFQRGFGYIRHDDKQVILINEYNSWCQPNPGAYLKGECKFLDENELCTLHDLRVNEDSNLGIRLRKYRASLKVKPSVCRAHPYFYDAEKDIVKKYRNCQEMDFINELTAIITENKEVLEEGRKIWNMDELLNNYYIKKDKYPIVKIAERMIKWKKKEPLKKIRVEGKP